MPVYVFNCQRDLNIRVSSVKAIVKEALALECVPFNDVSIHFVDSNTIGQLHMQYFEDPAPTDCISFPIDDNNAEDYRVLGEVFVCPKTAIDYAITHQRDAYLETTLYIVHGLLHLIGYDDVGSQEVLMREAEERVMNHLEQQHLILCCNRGNK